MEDSDIDRVERRIYFVLGMTVALIPIFLAMLAVCIVMLARSL